MTDILDILAKKNEFPIVFIGSGISKRFLNNFPDWPNLLREFWEKAGLQNFYGELNNTRAQIQREYPEFNDKENNHEAYIQMGAKLENEFNTQFNQGNILIENFSQEDAFNKNLSPLKKAIANRFKTYSFKPGFDEEYSAFVRMLLKTQIILTTNYDTFIEDSYDKASSYKITKYVGQRGFFKDTYDYAELYKLHGCAENPEDIILTKDDYNKFEKNSVLISAKIISIMLNSPIIFMGYSLTDINVRRIIQDFTRSISDEEVQLLEDRLILIEWKDGENDLIEEVLNDRDLGCKLKVIKTNNFKSVFEKISAVNQGVAPSEVRKYKHIIKELIVDSGKKGSLNSLLVSPMQLDDIERRIGDNKLIVALGDATYIFQMPDLISYVYNYFFETDKIHTDIAFRYIASQPDNSRIPFWSYIKDVNIDQTNLHNLDKDKIKRRVAKFSNIDECTRTINASYKIKKNSLDSIINLKFKEEKEFDVIAYNAENLDRDQLREYLLTKLNRYKEEGARALPTSLRRIFMIYDLLINRG
ncbi:SIR2 family protein [Paenibacillus polymyxa]|uniref:SIR2 family protein n=1 Tax=Paenibacillus polymyxa TaxID=1406 RepID=UPI000F85EEC8|nr:SIR2 family protein [Paenibacillus polymyxa]QDA26485.1 hypothetical protein FGY93_05540 [Paenibacillus polymyxa]RTZ30032.1 hypothetical protein EJ573_24430 [Paenibacillus polymyxa]